MEPEVAGAEYRIRVCDTASAIDAGAWNALLQEQPAPTPFMRHELLQALESSGSAVPATGWHPRWIVLSQGGRLRAGCALYLKSHSFGEYVFDWSWADAWRRHGLAYYPKAVVAVPFTPVPGTRLLAADDTWRRRLVAAIEGFATQAGLSSAHVLFGDDTDIAALAGAGWTLRHGVQFHWRQDAARPAADFDALLGSMQRDKRKKILQERRRVAEAGVQVQALEGDGIGPGEWDFFYRCYVQTYREHHATPYLRREFFTRMAGEMAPHWVMFLARRQGRPIACSLIAVDRARGAAWGRYWGAVEDVPCLHFEACYYQPLAWCLANGIERFEGGAQGEHKMARGLLPVTTRSAHWVADAGFADAVARALADERAGIDEHVDALGERSPFRRPAP